MKKSVFSLRNTVAALLLAAAAVFNTCREDPDNPVDPNDPGSGGKEEQGMAITKFSFDGMVSVEIDSAAGVVRAVADPELDPGAIVPEFTLSKNATMRYNDNVVDNKTELDLHRPASVYIQSGDGRTEREWTISVIRNHPEGTVFTVVEIPPLTYSEPVTRKLVRNGVEQKNFFTGNSGNSAIFVSGNNFYEITRYVKKYYEDTTRVGYLYKNGEAMKKLPTMSLHYSFLGNIIFVSESNDVYEISSSDDGDYIYTSVYRNRENVFEPRSYKGSRAVVSIDVSGDNDVYLVGTPKYWHWNGTASQATLWKNFEDQEIPNSPGIPKQYPYAVELNAVFVSGPNVYMAGECAFAAGTASAVWINGEPKALPNTESKENWITSMYVDNGDVYVAGWRPLQSGHGRARYWKNGTEYVLGNAVQSFADDIAVVNGDVYVTGTEYNNSGERVPVLWKNGEAIYPAEGIAGSGSGIYVTGGKPEEDSEYIEPDGNRTGNVMFIDTSPGVNFEITLNGETKKTRDSYDVEKYGLPDCRTDIPSGIYATQTFTNLPYGKYTARISAMYHRNVGGGGVEEVVETYTKTITVDRYCQTSRL